MKSSLMEKEVTSMRNIRTYPWTSLCDHVNTWQDKTRCKKVGPPRLVLTKEEDMVNVA